MSCFECIGDTCKPIHRARSHEYKRETNIYVTEADVTMYNTVQGASLTEVEEVSDEILLNAVAPCGHVYHSNHFKCVVESTIYKDGEFVKNTEFTATVYLNVREVKRGCEDL